MILRARAIWARKGRIIEDGALQVRGDKIGKIGHRDEVEPDDGEPCVDLGESVVFPAFVNAHCHLDFTGLAGELEPRFQLTRQTGEIQMTMRVDKGRKNNRLSEIHTRLPIIRFHFVAMTYFPDFVAANLQRTILDDASFSSPDCSRSKNH